MNLKKWNETSLLVEHKRLEEIKSVGHLSQKFPEHGRAASPHRTEEKDFKSFCIGACGFIPFFRAKGSDFSPKLIQFPPKCGRFPYRIVCFSRESGEYSPRRRGISPRFGGNLDFSRRFLDRPVICTEKKICLDIELKLDS